MYENLLEKHEEVAIEMGNLYLGNMESELGKKYKDRDYEINAALTDAQHDELKEKFDLTGSVYTELYFEFQKMEPTKHMMQLMSAFTASGGSADIEPVYDEESEALKVTVNYLIKDKKLDSIEGLSAIEEMILKLNAMLQVVTILSGQDEDISPTF